VSAYGLTLPASRTPGCLSVDGSGVLSWASCVALPINDSSILLRDDVDPTKQGRFELSGVGAGATRVLTFQNADYTIAGTNIAQTFSATQAFQDINSASAGLYVLGATNHFAGVRANQFDGVTGATPGVNWMRTRKLEFWDEGGGGAFWYATALAASGNSALNIRDNAGNIRMSLQSTLFSSPSEVGTMYGNWVPDVLGRSLGSSGKEWDARLRNIVITGTCTGCASGISSINGLTAGTQFLTFGSSGSSPNVSSSVNTHTFNIPFAGTGVSAGLISNGTQTLGGDKFFQGSILPSVGSTYSNGNSTYPWLYMTARNVEVTDGFGSNWRFNSSGNFLQLTNPGGAAFMQWDATLSRIYAGTNFVPLSFRLYDLGISAFPWRTAYITNLDMPSSGSITAYVGTGNFYNRTFSGTPFCGGVTDGWTGVDTFNQRIWVCIGGTARYAQLF
jgi:hypothetical protein